MSFVANGLVLWHNLKTQLVRLHVLNMSKSFLLMSNRAGAYLNFDLAYPSQGVPNDFFPSDEAVYGYTVLVLFFPETHRVIYLRTTGLRCVEYYISKCSMSGELGRFQQSGGTGERQEPRFGGLLSSRPITRKYFHCMSFLL